MSLILAKEWLRNNAPDIAEHIFPADGKLPKHTVLESMHESAIQYNRLTPKQIQFARQIVKDWNGNPTPERMPSKRKVCGTNEYWSICEYLELQGPYCKSSHLYARFGVPKNSTKIFQQKLNALEALGVVHRSGRRAYKWTVTKNWREILEGQKQQPQQQSGSSETEEKLAAQVIELQQKLDKIRNEVKDAKKKQIVEIQLVRKDGKKKTIKERTHEQFPKAMQLASARKHVLMVGPAGCGKSYLAEQVARHLKLDYGHINCSIGMSEGQLTGRLIPMGKQGQFKYCSTPFVSCYENGGVFLMDELDAADPNVLIVLNTALANGHLPVPNRPEKPVAKRHKDFVFMTAANTYGKGSDRQYVGRNELDEATLDRFRIGMIEMDYDQDLEQQLVTNDELRERFWRYRERIMQSRLERIVSTRFLVDAQDMIKSGWSIEQVEDQFFAGWSDDEIRKVKY